MRFLWCDALRGENATRKPHAARAIRNRQPGFLHRLLGDQIPAVLMRWRGSPRLIFQQSRPHEPGSSARQLRARLHPEFAQQRRHMEFHSAHRDIQPRRNFLVRAVVDHRVQDFSLPGAQRRWASDRAPLSQQFLGPRYQPRHQRLFGRNQNLKLRGILPAHQTLHRQQPCDALDGALQISAARCTKLRRAAGRFTKEEQAGVVRFLFRFVGNEFWKNTNFFQSEPSVCLPRIACGEALEFKSHFAILHYPAVSLHLVLHEVLTETGQHR
jgi:hypothetical protein